jgi:Cu(I)/Ag(I) efflux system periplasmic protein CusF
MTTKIFPCLLVAAGLGLAIGANAEAQTQVSPDGPAAAATAPLVDGEVRKVDKAQGKITLRHGPIPNLDMAGMTMVFKVADATWLDVVKPGDKVRFSANSVNGSITVTRLEVAK